MEIREAKNRETYLFLSVFFLSEFRSQLVLSRKGKKKKTSQLSSYNICARICIPLLFIRKTALYLISRFEKCNVTRKNTVFASHSLVLLFLLNLKFKQ
jgi:hypothetical protein